MKTATIFISILILIQLPTFLNGQSYAPPTPIMTKKLLKNFMHAHIVYPEKAIEDKTEGKVIIEFQIDKNGQISNRWIINHVSPEVDASALKLFDLILWKPATSYGIPIESTSEFEISFNLKKYAKYVKSRGYDQIIHKGFLIDSSFVIYKLSQLSKAPQPIIEDKYENLESYIFSQMKYPDDAQKLGIKGSVKLSFVIETNGIPSNIQVIETLGGGCCEESIRILQLIRWIPGISDDQFVRTNYDLSFHFNPSENRSRHIPNQSNSGL